jgi:GNAT superfamily N-acetyltransferase
MSKKITSFARNGNFNGVKAMLNERPNSHANQSWGVRPLAYAALGGHLPIVRLLLDRGANINARDNNGFTALMRAAQEGRIAVVKELLDRGANINARDSDGFTALIRAARRGQGEVIQLLLERGANKTGLANVQPINNYRPPPPPQYTTSKNKPSVLKNKPGVKRPPLRGRANLSKVEKLKHYLTNVKPNKIKLNVSNNFNNILNQNVKVFKLRYLINGKNAGNAVAVVPVRNGPVHFGEGATHKDFRGRGVGTLLRALLTKAVLKSGYNRILHQGKNKEKRSTTRPNGNRGIATSTWILRRRLGFKKVPDDLYLYGNTYFNSAFTKNNNQSKINSILRNAGLNL